jgi:3-hydroxyacyl-[acyl-carrier-protein] dehydratase
LLLNNLYTIQTLAESERQIQVTINLVSNHAIFKGHFPDQPVLPGVCMMEMVTEIAGHYLQKSFRISGSPLVKFLRMIDPQKNPLIHFEINYQSAENSINTQGMIFSGPDIFMKFQLNLVPEPGN